MVSLTKRKIKGNIYWYAVKTERVNGQPRIVWQQYLGTAEKITNCIVQRGSAESIKLKTMPLGQVAALARANEELRFVDIIDKHTKKKDVGGLSVGQYLLIQLMGRAEGALSRNAIAEWYPGSVTKLLIHTTHEMNAKNLLKHLDYPTDDVIRAIEDDISTRLIELGLKPSMLLWDTTNFFTRIDHGGTIPQKGYSKDNRNDRNLIGVGLAVSSENVPFFHETFEANEHDSKVFSNVLDTIVERLRKLKIDAEEVVMVLDKGNNSDENIGAVVERTHIIGTLRYDQAEDYIGIPLKEFEPIDETEDKDALLAYRTKGVHYGNEFTIVVTYNPRTHRKQQAKFEEDKARIIKELAAHKVRIEKRGGRGRRWTQTRAIRAIVDIIPLNMRSVFRYDVSKKVGRGGGLIMTFGIDTKKEEQRYRSFGKIVHFTDLHERSSKEISMGYNSRYQVEDDFRWLKDKLLVPIKPVYVRTDDHIRSHVFICIMGLLFYRYLQWRLRKAGIDLSTQELAKVLDDIRLAIIKKGQARGGKVVVEEMERLSARIFSILDMGEFIKA